ncbi:MAG TPA: hypothetical protein VGY56_13780, partial [Verrucomicrobiae bacterium]|nr:hypothetical protein [Verrucomicrobiae bacterium]
MVLVKIQCVCGQKYAFDVEPVNGRMPAAVGCPSCGADGTAAANDFIAQKSVAGSATGQVPDTPATTVATTTSENVAPRKGTRPTMRLARAQVQTEAGVSPAVAPDDAGRTKLVQEARTKIT